jgi:hypothetical protein
MKDTSVGRSQTLAMSVKISFGNFKLSNVVIAFVYFFCEHK